MKWVDSSKPRDKADSRQKVYCGTHQPTMFYGVKQTANALKLSAIIILSLICNFIKRITQGADSAFSKTGLLSYARVPETKPAISLSATIMVARQFLSSKVSQNNNRGAQGKGIAAIQKPQWTRTCQKPWALVILFLIPMISNAQVNFSQLPEKGGFYFYEQPAKPVVLHTKPERVTQSSLPNQIRKRKINCANPKEWQAQSCGFVVPMSLKNWSDSYAFEQQEYKALLPYSVFSTTPTGAISPKANLQWQRFQNWALDWAMQYSYVWDYVRLQHPDVNSVAQAPVSQFGNNLIRNINAANEQAYLKNLSKTAMLVFFTRHGDKGTPQYCPICQAMAPVVLDLSQTTGIPVYEASLDHKHFEHFNYHLWPQTKLPAQILKVSIVPTLFLYLKPNEQGKGAQWIRVAINAEAEDTIKKRIVNFAQGFRDAIVSGFESASKKLPNSPDFRREYNNWLAVRGTATQAENNQHTSNVEPTAEVAP